MRYFYVTIQPKEGLYKKVRLTEQELFPIKLADHFINEQEDRIYLTNLVSDDTLIVSSQEARLVKEWQQSGVTQSHLAEYPSFFQILLDNNFVVACGKYRPCRLGELPKPQLQNFELRYLRPFYVYFMLMQLTTISVGVTLLFVRYQQLFPRFEDFFWSQDIFILFVGSFVISYSLVILHESAHFLTAKIFGVESRIHLFSVRSHQLVSETEHFFVYTVSRNQRILIYLAGVLFDAFTASVAIILVHLLLIPEPWMPLIRYFILVQLLGVWWQLNVYFKTDIYNVISDLFKQENLYEDALRYVQLKMKNSGIPKIVRTVVLRFFATDAFTTRLSTLSKSQRRKAQWFAILLIIGVLQSLVMTCFITVPRDIVLFKMSIGLVVTADSFVKAMQGLLIMTILLWNYVFIGLLQLRNYRRFRVTIK